MLILASASPRRHELLLRAGMAHAVRPSYAPEERFPNEDPIQFVKRIAELKARTVARDPGEIVLAADTVVVVGDRVFGKPTGHKDAVRMLKALSGVAHWVYTGICILAEAAPVLDAAATKVRFMELSDKEIESYVRSGEPFDKAGAYAIQGLASKFVASVEGSYDNVVGLPIAMVYSHLKLIGNIS